MGRKSKFTTDEKLKYILQCIEGKASVRHIANLIGVNHVSLRQWIFNYQSLGVAGLSSTSKASNYSEELKEFAIKDYLSGGGSQLHICFKYGIRSKSTLHDWVLKYNRHKEQEECKTGGIPIMTSSRKPTCDEKLEIVRYCIEHQKNYVETSQKYLVSYHQVYSWTSKYLTYGIEALQDKRVKVQNEGEMSELERLKAENFRQQMEIDFLKKLDEIERRRY